MTREEAINMFKSLIEGKSQLNACGIDSEYGFRCGERFFKALEIAIKVLEKTRWIPISERLPKEDGCYLVTAELVVGKSIVEISSFAKNLYSVDEYEFSNKKGKSGWYNYDDDYGYWLNEEVIAWMPLPEPYTAESEE